MTTERRRDRAEAGPRETGPEGPGLTIGVDARELTGRPTGVGRYLARVLERWAALPEAHPHRALLYAPAIPAIPPPGGGMRLEARLVPGTPGTAWEQLALARALRADRPDVLFAPGYSAPLAARLPVVLTVHDVSFFAHPEWFPARQGFRRRWTTRLAARRARLVLTVSEFSRNEIRRLLGLPDARLRVIPQRVDGPEARPGAPPTRQPQVLFVGSLFNRRHLPDLIHAFARLAARRSDARLDIVGDDRTFPPQDLAGLAAALGVGARVSIRSWVPDAALADLYATASVFAFLSEYEGFGLTPLEALARGVPLVVLDTPVAREVYGEAAWYVAPGDVDGTAAALLALLEDDRARAAHLARAPEILARYSWEATAQATLDAILEAASWRSARFGAGEASPPPGVEDRPVT